MKPSFPALKNVDNRSNLPNKPQIRLYVKNPGSVASRTREWEKEKSETRS